MSKRYTTAQLRRIEAIRLANEGRGKYNLTPVTGLVYGEPSATVHLGYDLGTYDTSPICGLLAARDTETTDTPANCSGCAAVVREIGLGHLLRDEDGWTGLYEPRRSNR